MTAIPIPNGFQMGVPIHRLIHGSSLAIALNTTTLLMDANAEKIALVGYFWNPTRASKTIDGFEFRTAALTDGGALLTCSLQNVLLTAGKPSVPDEGVALASLVDIDLTTIPASAWYGNDFTDSEAVAYNQLLAFVVEFGTGGAAASAFRLAGCNAEVSTGQHEILSVLKTASWAAQPVVPNIVFRCTDGTFGTLRGAIPVVTINTHTFNSGSTPDEIAVGFQLGAPVSTDGFALLVDKDNDVDLVLYAGTTALQTTTIDADIGASTTVRHATFPLTEQALTKDTLYRFAIKPGAASSSIYTLDVNEAGHLGLLGGQAMHYWDRTNAGAWSNETLTRTLLGAVQLSQIDDGAGGGGGLLTHPGMGGGMRA